MSIGSVSTIHSPDPVPGLQGLVRRKEIDLQDWLTCVSASTPKGKAEIQSLSAQVSAARAAISRAQQQSAPAAPSAPAASHTASATTGRLDVWA